MSTYLNFFRAFSQRNVNLTDVLDDLDSDYSLFQRGKGNPYSSFKEHIEDYIDYTETLPKSLMSEGSVLLSNAKFWIIYISMKISTEKDKKRAVIQLFNESTLYDITDKKMYEKFFIEKIKEVFSFKELINVINSNPKTKKKLKPSAKNSDVTKMLNYTLFNPNFFNEIPPEQSLYVKKGKKFLQKDEEEKKDNKDESSDEGSSIINRKKKNSRQKGNKRAKTVPKKDKKNTAKTKLNKGKEALKRKIKKRETIEISSDEDESEDIEEIKKEIADSSIEEEIKPQPKKKSTLKKATITNRSKSCSRSNKTKKDEEDDDEVDLKSEIDISSDESISSPSESSSPKRANKAKTQPVDITMKSIDFDENELGLDLDLNSILEHEEDEEIAKELMKYDKAKKKRSKK